MPGPHGRPIEANETKGITAKNFKISERIRKCFYINMSFFLALKSEMQKLQETEIQRRELHSRMEFMQKQFETEKLQVLLSF